MFGDYREPTPFFCGAFSGLDSTHGKYIKRIKRCWAGQHINQEITINSIVYTDEIRTPFKTPFSSIKNIPRRDLTQGRKYLMQIKQFFIGPV